MHSVMSRAESVSLTLKSVASMGRMGCGAYSMLTATAVSRSMVAGGRCDIIGYAVLVLGQFSKSRSPELWSEAKTVIGDSIGMI